MKPSNGRPAGPGDKEGHRGDDVYTLDVEGSEVTDADEVAREAVRAVEKIERRPRGSDDAGEAAGGDDEAAVVGRLEEELAELRDRSVRVLADFDNYRKRAEREREEMRRFAAFDLLRELLPPIDNLERALAASGKVEDLKAGVELIARQLADLLKQQGVEVVPAVGEPFDPGCHEAVGLEQRQEVEAPTVVDELQRGYRLYGRLLRPSLVRVAVPSSDAGGAAADDLEEAEGGDGEGPSAP